MTQSLKKREENGGDAVREVTPPVDVFENDTGYWVRADLPGVTAEELQVELKGQVLSLSGEVPAAGRRRAVRYRRSFLLPKDADAAALEADLKYGVLDVRIGKLPAAQPRRIEVRAS